MLVGWPPEASRRYRHSMACPTEADRNDAAPIVFRIRNTAPREDDDQSEEQKSSATEPRALRRPLPDDGGDRSILRGQPDHLRHDVLHRMAGHASGLCHAFPRPKSSAHELRSNSLSYRGGIPKRHLRYKLG